jgi:uncharacterized protein YbbC (DUF1343 family)
LTPCRGLDPEAEEPGKAPVVALGIDRVLADPDVSPLLYSAERVGLTSSRQCRTGKGMVVPDALLNSGVRLVRLFGPEHGVSGRVADGSPVSDTVDPRTGLPAVSLYGPRLGPDLSTLAGLDLMVFDLQDVGARFYTFLWTLSTIMQACAEAKVPVVVLDRPNPIGGAPEAVEGPVQEDPERSGFLGRWPIPVRHSLTIGELALLLREEMGLETDLQVVPVQGWKRVQHWPDIGLPFHPPSPGIPSYESALFYPGLAFLEATNMLEGRGGPYAFRWIGAQWIESRTLAAEVHELSLPGVGASAMYLPLPGGEKCPGVALHAENPKAVRPVATGLRLLALLRTLWPAEFRWEPYPTQTNPTGSGHLLRLLGRREIVSLLETGPLMEAAKLIEAWTDPGDWWIRTEPHRLYDADL